MSKDFTVDELYELIEFDRNTSSCGYDELLLLIADFIDDERITKVLEKYVDLFDECFRGEYVCLQEMKKKLEKHLTVTEILRGTYEIGLRPKEKREKLLRILKEQKD